MARLLGVDIPNRKKIEYSCVTFTALGLLVPKRYSKKRVSTQIGEPNIRTYWTSVL